MNPWRHVQTLSKGLLRLRQRGQPRGAILMYHRIASAGADPWRLNVSAEHFIEHMAVLRKCTTPISLRALIEALHRGQVTDRSVVVTFDDGYANNLHAALPVLQRFDVPATVFVTTGQVGSGHEFWWDELEQMLLRARPLPAALTLSVGRATRRWELGTAVNAPEEPGRPASRATAGSRLAFYHDVWQTLVPLIQHDRHLAMGALKDWSGVEPTTRQTHRPLTGDEIATLSSHGLVEIGAHTVTHPRLPALPRSAQRAEIGDGKTHLERLVGKPVTSFSYPFGKLDQVTATLVREAGFNCAVSNESEAVWRASSPMQLPRLVVEDWDGEQFERHLRRWLPQSNSGPP